MAEVGGEDWGGRGAEEGAATRAAPLAWAQWEASREVRGAAEAVEVHLVSEAGLEVEKVAVRVVFLGLAGAAMAAETGEVVAEAPQERVEGETAGVVEGMGEF